MSITFLVKNNAFCSTAYETTKMNKNRTLTVIYTSVSIHYYQTKSIIMNKADSVSLIHTELKVTL